MSALPPWTHWECPKQSCSNRIKLRLSGDHKPTCDNPKHTATTMKRATR